MNTIINSIWIALSLYTVLPVPQANWTDDNKKYSMCFFPLAGGLVSGVMWIAWLLSESAGRRFGAAPFMRAAVMTILPVILTGGIHTDGFLDTVDALKSYRSKSRKFEIMKDPHVGSAAVVHVVLYFILTFGLYAEMKQQAVAAVCLGFILSRALSGFSIISFPKAKADGMAVDAAQVSDGRVRRILLGEIIGSAALMVIFGGAEGNLAVAAALLVFIYYRWKSQKEFGGVTGDLAGWFLQICELGILAVSVTAALVLG